MSARATRLGQFSWALYDWANSAFSAVIITFVYATYFTKGIAGERGRRHRRVGLGDVGERDRDRDR